MLRLGGLSMRVRILAMGLAITAILSAAAQLGGTARAGEFGAGFAGCDLASSFGCTWKPTGCSKPTPPSALVFNRDDYNDAVDEFNFYLHEVASYKECLLDDAKEDVSKRFPDLVTKGVADAAHEVDSARAHLEFQRPDNPGCDLGVTVASGVRHVLTVCAIGWTCGRLRITTDQ